MFVNSELMLFCRAILSKFARFYARRFAKKRVSPYENAVLSRFYKTKPTQHPSRLDPHSEEAKYALEAALALYDEAERLVNDYANCYYDGRHPKHHLWVEHHRFLFNECSPEDSVIDIGCGGSAYQSWIAEKVARFVAVDQDPERISIAKKNSPDSKVEYRVMDVTRELPPGEFDVAICSHVLEHLDDPVDFLVKLQSKVQRIIIKVPLVDSHWIKLVKKDLGLFWLDDHDHRREYTEALLEQHLTNAGWKVKEMTRGFDLRATAIPGNATRS